MRELSVRSDEVALLALRLVSSGNSRRLRLIGALTYSLRVVFSTDVQKRAHVVTLAAAAVMHETNTVFASVARRLKSMAREFLRFALLLWGKLPSAAWWRSRTVE
jgi:hypothetical protein